MFRNALAFPRTRWSLNRRWTFILFWCSGLLLGAWLAFLFCSSDCSLMLAQCFQRVSIVTHLAFNALPFLLAALAVFICKIKFIPLLCFCRTTSFSLAAGLIYRSFGSAGWLMLFLVMFAQILLLPLFCWYCLRSIDGASRTHARDFLICLGFCTAVTVMDQCLIAPILASITFV